MMIGKFLQYRGYVGSIEYSSEDNLHHGKLLNIDDLVTYEADNVIDLEKQYRKAVDDYIEIKEVIDSINMKIKKK